MTNDTGKPNESNLDASSNNLAIKETTIKQSTEIPKSYTDLNFIAVKKADIQKVVAKLQTLDKKSLKKIIKTPAF